MSQGTIEADWTWTGESFEAGMRLSFDQAGNFSALDAPRAPGAPGSTRPVGDSDGDSDGDSAGDSERWRGRALLPGFVNAHSHAFQRGLRGQGERFPAGAGSFWTWREAMYGLVGEMTPGKLKELCLSAFREMLAAGMTTVGEFHYLHHASSTALDHEFDAVVLAAAKEAGIRIVLLNAYYSSAGFASDGKRAALEESQARFATPTPEAYWSAFDSLQSQLDGRTQTLGVVVHSMRAASPGELGALQEEARRRGLVLHIHLEEQRREVEECQRSHGMTPMALLLETLGQGASKSLDNVCAVHCTHTAPGDMDRFLAAGGRVCLTPTTEASLGDGIPDLRRILGRNGALSLGSDSNTRISMFEEMRWVEYAQRLAREERGVARAQSSMQASGKLAPNLLGAATRGGALALGLDAGELKAGCRADFFSVDLEHPTLLGVDPEHLPEALALACDDRVIRDVFVGGKRIQ